MDVAVSRRNTLCCDRTLLNYWNRAKEKPMDCWYLCWESKGAPSECDAVAMPLGPTC